MTPIADPELRGLAAGETVVAFVPAGAAEVGATLTLTGAGPLDPADLKPAYRRWATEPAPSGPWTALVVAVYPVTPLLRDRAAGRHLRATMPDGDALVLRVAGTAGPVLSDAAFTARVRSLERELP